MFNVAVMLLSVYHYHFVREVLPTGYLTSIIYLHKMTIYRREIVELLGDNLIGVIKELTKKGSLTKVNIKDIADSLEVREEYDKQNDQGCDLICIFESILDAWYEDFRDGPPPTSEAQETFLSVLRETHCVPYVINEVEKAFKSKLKVIE